MKPTGDKFTFGIGAAIFLYGIIVFGCFVLLPLFTNPGLIWFSIGLYCFLLIMLVLFILMFWYCIKRIRKSNE